MDDLVEAFAGQNFPSLTAALPPQPAPSSEDAIKQQQDMHLIRFTEQIFSSFRGENLSLPHIFTLAASTSTEDKRFEQTSQVAPAVNRSRSDSTSSVGTFATAQDEAWSNQQEAQELTKPQLAATDHQKKNTSSVFEILKNLNSIDDLHHLDDLPGQAISRNGTGSTSEPSHGAQTHPPESSNPNPSLAAASAYISRFKDKLSKSIGTPAPTDAGPSTNASVLTTLDTTTVASRLDALLEQPDSGSNHEIVPQNGGTTNGSVAKLQRAFTPSTSFGEHAPPAPSHTSGHSHPSSSSSSSSNNAPASLPHDLGTDKDNEFKVLLQDNTNLRDENTRLKTQNRDLRLQNTAIGQENSELKLSNHHHRHHQQPGLKSQDQVKTPPDLNSSPDEGYQASASSSSNQKNPIHQWRQFAGAGAKRHIVPWDPDHLQQSILLNIDYHRVDEILPPCDPDVMKRVYKPSEGERFCVNYCLLGECANERCIYQHEKELSGQEILCLRHLQRKIPCTTGVRCRRPDCFYGHVCRSYPKCTFGKGCHWYSTHGMNLTAVHVQ